MKVAWKKSCFVLAASRGLTGSTRPNHTVNASQRMTVVSTPQFSLACLALRTYDPCSIPAFAAEVKGGEGGPSRQKTTSNRK